MLAFIYLCVLYTCFYEANKDYYYITQLHIHCIVYCYISLYKIYQARLYWSKVENIKVGQYTILSNINMQFINFLLCTVDLKSL